jgi:hypothetical protein
MDDNQIPQKAAESQSQNLALIEKRLTNTLNTHHQELCDLLKHYLNDIQKQLQTLNDTLKTRRETPFR